MKQTITRTITTSIVEWVIVEVKDGKPELTEQDPITIMGKVDKKKALKELPDGSTVTDIKEETETYEMNLSDFLKNAVVINKEEK